ncbi:c-type cytochrome [Roseimaritima sediminicola]|uniref:c-type cytochrome n=1 Tax=Roseimaritima sediminicola TaxID=2662066 RepID=UPI001298334A|nr:c-type cytochrome [Roseimaritima sediminicola]
MRFPFRSLRGRVKNRRCRSKLFGFCLLLATALPFNTADGQDGASFRHRAFDWGFIQRLAGKWVFRHDTFGNEPFWTGQLRLHEVIQTAVDPLTALELGLKVDADRLPSGFLERADLSDPQTTLALLRRNAVLGLKAKVTRNRKTGDLQIVRLGTTCALCHSVVDDSVAPGIGSRLDGWPNLDLNVGAIVASSPAIDESTKKVFLSWGPGRYDPYFNQDGESLPVVLPPAYGLQDVDSETFLGVGPVSYWNSYVAVTQMHGQGAFFEPALGLDIRARPDRVTPKLNVLLKYQLALKTPAPPAGSFVPAAAARGEEIFMNKANCATCHVPPTFTDAPALWDPEFIPTDPAYALRPASITKKWRTTPLRGLWQHAPYFHDGSAETLEEVVETYDLWFELELTAEEKADLVQFLRSL